MPHGFNPHDNLEFLANPLSAESTGRRSCVSPAAGVKSKDLPEKGAYSCGYGHGEGTPEGHSDHGLDYVCAACFRTDHPEQSEEYAV